MIRTKPLHTFLAPVLFLLVTLSGCSILFGSKVVPSKIVAAPFGMTKETRIFKVGQAKPTGHVIWGNDIEEGTPCNIVITNTSLGKTVYKLNFIFTNELAKEGYHYPGGSLIELDSRWYYKIGTYVVTLYAREERVSSYTFDIKP